MQDITKNIIKLMFIFAMTFAVIISVSDVTEAASTKKMDINGSNTVTVELKDRNRSASVKLNVYEAGHPWGNKAVVIVTMRDEHGNFIWQGEQRGGDTLNLGNDHRVYQITISKTGDTFNQIKSAQWSLSSNNNCKFI